jgi:hypothetical protein
MPLACCKHIETCRQIHKKDRQTVNTLNYKTFLDNRERERDVSGRWPGGRSMTVINTSSPLFPLSNLQRLHLNNPWLT